MATFDQPRLGPSVRLVVGPDELVEAHAPGEAPHGVIHLRPDRPGRDIIVLHHNGRSSDAVPALAERLIWLDGRAGAPELIASGRSDEFHETVVIRMPAEAIVASDPIRPVDPESLARMIGSSLKAIHCIDVDGCPFDASIEKWHRIAVERVNAGVVETESEGPYARLEPRRLLEVLDELIEATNDRHDAVVIHGMPSHGHTWLVHGGTVVFTGWQKCGIGDRHHDLAVSASSLTKQFGPALVPPLLDSYGFDHIDLRRLDLHQLLVHLVGVAT